MKSWKQELDSKYRKLMNMGSISVTDRANTVILQAISDLDKIQVEINRRGVYNLRREGT